MTLVEFCMLLLALVVFTLTRILSSLIHECGPSLVTQDVRNAGENAPGGAAFARSLGGAPPLARQRASTVQNDDLAARIPGAFPLQNVRAGARIVTPGRPAVVVRHVAPISPSAAAAGTSSSPVSGPSRRRSPCPMAAAGPSTPSAPFRAAASPHGTYNSGVDASVPWSPKKGWSSTYRVSGVVYHRTEKKMRPRKSLKPGSPMSDVVITRYWEPELIGSRLIDSPPDLTGDPNLAVGDIFIYLTASQYRLWIYRSSGYWERVEVGYEREDGRVLIVTSQKKEPSWVSRDYYERFGLKRANDADSD